MLSQHKPGGTVTYSRETLRRITAMHPEHQFLFIVDRPFSKKNLFPDNVTVFRLFPSVHPLLFYPWFEWAVPYVLKRFKADIFLSTDGFTSLSTTVPSVIVIHDLGFCHYPMDLPFFHRHYYNRFFPMYARRASAIATVSEYSKKDIVSLYSQPPEKVVVTYNAVSDEFAPLSETQKKAARQEFAGGSPYLLHVGLLHPRKNIVRLIEAFDKFRQENTSDAKLILAGPKLFKTGDLFQTWNRIIHKNEIHFLGTVPQETLLRLYGGARALVNVSYFEGFGIPVLEAMACDVPVVASNRTALPEVCGDAALLIDPRSVEAIAEAMKAVFFDEDLRRSLLDRQRQRKKLFSWEKTADLLWQTLERALS